MSKPFYITTPIYYVNDVPHIGHAYTTIAADVLARYKRLTGYDVFFLTGLDEHGQKVQQAAEKAGQAPQAYCDRLAPQFQRLWKKLSISNDAFIRTTDPPHKAYVQKTLQVLFDKGLIYQADYTGWYCTFDERFWTEKDVVEGLCPECQRPIERLSERNYFFKMGQFQNRLLEHIRRNPAFIRPEARRNEVLGFLQKPLEDLSISRPKSRLAWGIELPFDPNYVTYVWFDALVNYLSALDYLMPDASRRGPVAGTHWGPVALQNATGPRQSNGCPGATGAPHASFDRYWPATLHLVGKDILTTHAVYWSTMLMALELPLPTTLFAHGWWTVSGEKMSKSRGNVVDPNAVIDEFGADAFRYFLLREVPFGQDGDYSREALIGRTNSELANDLGNLLNRTLTMIERYANGRVPQPGSAKSAQVDNELQHTATQLKDMVELHLEHLEFSRALEAIWSLVQLGNQYLEKTAPWTLAKKATDRPRLNTVLYNAAESLRFLTLFLYPFLPQAAEEMTRQLGLRLNFSNPLLASPMKWGDLQPGTEVAKGNPLFPRIETNKTQGETRVTQDPQPSSLPHQISIEEFQKVQLKVAKVLSAERVPKSEKLLKLLVDLGGEQRQLVAGIGKKYEPETLVGKTVVVVANLKPATLMGVESQGMVLAAGDKDVAGLVTILEEVEPGTKVK